MSHYNRKIPLTRRTEYESNNKKDELDGIDTSYSDISVHESSNCSPKTVNGLDFIETGTNKAKSKASQCLICWCGKKCWKITESLDKEKCAHPFRVIDFLTTILSIIFYFYDVVSDIILAYKYYSLKRWLAFGFTAAFVFIPLIVINFKSLLWYKLDYTRERKGSGHTRCSVWFLRVIFTFPFMMGTVVRNGFIDSMVTWMYTTDRMDSPLPTRPPWTWAFVWIILGHALSCGVMSTVAHLPTWATAWSGHLTHLGNSCGHRVEKWEAEKLHDL